MLSSCFIWFFLVCLVVVYIAFLLFFYGIISALENFKKEKQLLIAVGWILLLFFAPLKNLLLWGMNQYEEAVVCGKSLQFFGLELAPAPKGQVADATLNAIQAKAMGGA